MTGDFGPGLVAGENGPGLDGAARVLGVAGEDGGTGEEGGTGVEGGTGLPGQAHKGPGNFGPGVPRIRRGTEEAVLLGV